MTTPPVDEPRGVSALNLRGLSWKALILGLYRKSRRDNVLNGAAALGFFLTLAIFPGMIFLMAVIPYLPLEHVDKAIMDLLRQALPPSAAEAFTSVVSDFTSRRRRGALSVGIVATLWSASTGMYAIMRQMNIAFGVAEGRGFLKARATALALTLLFGVLVLGAFSLIVAGGSIQGWLGERFGFSGVLLGFFVIFRWAVIVLALLLAFALVYFLAPKKDQPFAIATPGTVVATALLIAASLAFSLYISHFGSFGNIYGSMGAVVVLMLWLYMAGLVILVGAELDALLAEHPRPSGGDAPDLDPDTIRTDQR